MISLETKSAKDSDIVQLISFAAYVAESPGANINTIDAPSAVGDMSMVGTFALAARPLENIAPELCSVVHSLHSGPGITGEGPSGLPPSPITW